MDNKLQSALKKANEEVEKSGVTDIELKKIAFSKAVDFYLHGESKQIISQQANVEIKTDIFWETLSNSTRIEAKSLKDIFSIKDNQISLAIPTVPGTGKAEQQRNLAVLILFSYHEGLGYEWIPANFLAKAADHLKLYDTSKFAKNLLSKKTKWFSIKGIKRGREYKLSGPGIFVAKELLKTLIK